MNKEQVRRSLWAHAAAMGGAVVFDEPLAKYNTFFAGGTAFSVYSPSCGVELGSLVAYLIGNGIQYMVIGKGSNLLFKDIYYDKVFILLEHENFKRMTVSGKILISGAGAKLSSLITFSAKNGLSGFEGLAGIPGTLGGALINNASNKCAVSENLLSVKVINRDGAVEVIQKEKAEFSYRRSSLRETIILEAEFLMESKLSSEIRERIKMTFIEKLLKQPLEERTLGCVFKNPAGNFLPAGKLLENAGLKGARVGGALISGKHANFIVNSGGASSDDVARLMGVAGDKVFKMFGVELEPEIEIIG
ncbi:MAG: UDP-N-acetylmuramate dehydrogenase [Candidatus Omnitrophica bacterium]|nr:UDP-N-acetylmuramate dehydrogenase [Candidatus Omnitrophota bacterium]